MSYFKDIFIAATVWSVSKLFCHLVIQSVGESFCLTASRLGIQSSNGCSVCPYYSVRSQNPFGKYIRHLERLSVNYLQSKFTIIMLKMFAIYIDM